MPTRYLDTRDLQKRLDELAGLKEELDEANDELKLITEDPDESDPDIIDAAQDRLTNAEADFSEDDEAELAELQDLENEISEWHDGATLIPEDEFTNYCQEFLQDIGVLPNDLPHYLVIDWEATADNIRQDYHEVTYQGQTYLVRD